MYQGMRQPPSRSAVNDQSVTMTAMPSRITWDLIVGEVVDRAQDLALIERISIGVEMPGYMLDLL
jgi:hypothetical protein